jgi:hypothetical protein
VLTGGTKYLRHALVSSELLLLELGYVQFDLGCGLSLGAFLSPDQSAVKPADGC